MKRIPTLVRSFAVAVLLLFLSPLLGVIAAVIYISSGSPVLFRQKRTGFLGRPFTMLKFRTMTVGAEKYQERLGVLNEASGPSFKIYDDPRFTAVGKFLSHTGLDELPQLWNVLRGEMDIIGPRPLPVAEARQLTAWQRARERVRPGIISPWVFEGYHKHAFSEWMKSDIAYAKQKSALYDSLLLARGVVLLVRLILGEIARGTGISRWSYR